jgi:hypothetical protein
VSTQECTIDKGGNMGNFDREQLEALKRQIEDDYRLDMAAIERLQRRFVSAGPSMSSSKDTQPVERSVTVLPTLESQGEPQADELTSTLRGMFSSHRR